MRIVGVFLSMGQSMRKKQSAMAQLLVSQESDGWWLQGSSATQGALRTQALSFFCSSYPLCIGFSFWYLSAKVQSWLAKLQVSCSLTGIPAKKKRQRHKFCPLSLLRKGSPRQISHWILLVELGLLSICRSITSENENRPIMIHALNEIYDQYLRWTGGDEVGELGKWLLGKQGTQSVQWARSQLPPHSQNLHLKALDLIKNGL